MDNFVVYIHIRPDKNEPFYVGMGIKGRENRICGRNQYWKNIVNKNNGLFESKILFENLNENDALLKEREIEINLRDKGYKLSNILECGIKGRPAGLKHSKETIQKMSEYWIQYYIDNPSPKKGVKMSSESSLKKSKAMMGQKVRLNIKDSESAKINKSIGIKNRDPKWKEIAFTKERGEKISEKLKDKTIYKFYNTFTKEEFIGIRKDFKEQYKLSNSEIYKLINNIINKYKNWIKI